MSSKKGKENTVIFCYRWHRYIISVKLKISCVFLVIFTIDSIDMNILHFQNITKSTTWACEKIFSHAYKLQSSQDTLDLIMSVKKSCDVSAQMNDLTVMSICTGRRLCLYTCTRRQTQFQLTKLFFQEKGNLVISWHKT